MYVIVYLLKMGRLPKKKGKNVYLKMSPHVALLLQVTFTLIHPIGLILLVAESKEYIYMVNKWIFALK